MGWFRDLFGLWEEDFSGIQRDMAASFIDAQNNARIDAHVKHQHLMKMNKTHGVVVDDIVYPKGAYIKLHTPDVADTPTPL